MQVNIKKKSSFLKSDNYTKHIRFIISDPDALDIVLVVNATTCRGMRGEDMSCLLSRGDHPFIRDNSYIVYVRSEELKIETIVKLAKDHKIILKPDISEALLRKLQEGAKKSDQLPNKFYKYFSNF